MTPDARPNPNQKAVGDEEKLDLIVHVASNVSLKDVAERLKKAGHFVERELPISGVIGVKGGKSDMQRIERIPGVKLVKVGGSFRATSLD